MVSIADLLVVIGFALLVAGVGLVFNVGAALIVSGAALFAAGVRLQRRPVTPAAPEKEAAA